MICPQKVQDASRYHMAISMVGAGEQIKSSIIIRMLSKVRCKTMTFSRHFRYWADSLGSEIRLWACWLMLTKEEITSPFWSRCLSCLSCGSPQDRNDLGSALGNHFRHSNRAAAAARDIPRDCYQCRTVASGVILHFAILRSLKKYQRTVESRLHTHFCNVQRILQWCEMVNKQSQEARAVPTSP